MGPSLTGCMTDLWVNDTIFGACIEENLSVPLWPAQESPGGLYVGLSSFLGFSREFVELHYQKTREPLYLHITRTRKVRYLID